MKLQSGSPLCLGQTFNSDSALSPSPPLRPSAPPPSPRAVPTRIPPTGPSAPLNVRQSQQSAIRNPQSAILSTPSSRQSSTKPDFDPLLQPTAERSFGG